MGVYKICYTSVGGSDSIAQEGVNITVIPKTSNLSIYAVSPSSITDQVLTSISLVGDIINDGDNYTFIPKGSECSNVTPNLLVKQGEEIKITITNVGEYIMCYRRVGGSDR